MNLDVENIVKKAHGLFMKFGIKSVSMDDLARELGVSKKTLYQHISDKTELVKKVITYESECIAKAFRGINSDKLNAIEEMITLQKQVVRIQTERNFSVEFDLKKYYPEIYAKLNLAKRKRVYQSSVSNMAKGKKEGLYRKDLNEKAIAMLMVSRAEHEINFEELGSELGSMKDMIREIFIYHLRGICSTKGLDFLENNIDKLK